MAQVDVRREYPDLHGAALVYELYYLVGLILAGEVGGHELDGIVGLEVGGLVGDIGVGRGMGLVETVLGEILHRIVYLFRLPLGDTVCDSTFNEFFTHFCHLVHYLLAHRLPELIGLSHTEPAEFMGYPHHLLLIEDCPVGLPENSLKLGYLVGDPLLTLFPLYEVNVHAAAERAGPVKGDKGDEVLKTAGLELYKEFPHATAFKLEDPCCIPG